ncbi:uncharacterized protein LOC116338960 [Contarinia nasturtii]|uniref:uncharacterized protein LOC116338960 n=1 Tax=Contarinia nasturtii TaxID=265458 RepID=UPI0012D452C8|nr:uncharacterized protein LOC116338960 [Contarinia nasturtii]
MVNFTMDSMIEKCQTDVLYTDFEKAFDRVNHKRMLQKLVKFGFGRRLVKWFHGYLTARTQFVGIGERKSRTFTVSSGVPAGNDLKLIRKIQSPSDAITFQNSIDQLNDWCTENSLYLNLKKCFVMTYSKGGNAIDYVYTINNGHHTFERMNLHKDLGVIFDKKLTFVNHIDAITASAHAAMGFIKRTLKNKFTIETAKILYCGLVRSKLEYASIVWQPYHRIHSDRIESIQKDFVIWTLSFVYQRDENFVLPPYYFRCDTLNIQPLWRRRINASIFLIYDLLLGKIVSRSLRDKIVYTRLHYDVNQRNLRNTELIRIRRFTSEYAHNQPFYVACRNFNLVREQFMQSASREIFRNNIVKLENVTFIER